MMYFMVILVLSRVATWIRCAAVTNLMLYSLLCEKWVAFEFLAGMFLCEGELL